MCHYRPEHYNKADFIHITRLGKSGTGNQVFFIVTGRKITFTIDQKSFKHCKYKCSVGKN